MHAPSRISLFFTVCCIYSSVFGQSASNIKKPGRQCYTYQLEQLNFQKNPNSGSTAQFEKWIDQLKAKKKAQKNASATTVYTIPVIFHIIHNGESAGSGTNISSALISAQIEQLNEDYRKIGTGYNSNAAGGDSYIEFAPAVLDTNGNSLSEFGIDRIDRNSKGWNAAPYGDCSLGYFDPSYIENTIKPATIWDPTQYLNIWVMDIDCGILGYAQMPATTATVTSQLPDMAGMGGVANTDGVVLAYYSIGSVCTPGLGAPYNLGRTATHEIGHFLGLRHIWGDATCGDDYCADTPVHEDYNWGTPTHPKSNSCGTADEMFENFMDYTDDEVMNIFTNDQVERMRIILENSPRRVTLTSSGKCAASASNPKISFVKGCTDNSATTTENSANCGNYTSIPYTIRINRAPASDVTVQLAYSGTATYGTDYYLSDTLFTFPSGSDASQVFNVYVRQDALIESDETINLTISTVSGGSAGKDNLRQSLSITVNNDDATPATAAGIQQAVDTTTGYAEFEFGAGQTIYYRDQSTGAMILSLTNTSSHNFGCTRVQVIRAGTGANRAWSPNTAEYITAKTFKIIPEFNNTTTASYDVSLYYTESEIAGWESVTGQNRSSIQMIKTSGNIAQTNPSTSPEYAIPSHSTFGTGHIYTASYTTGFSSFGMGIFATLLPVEWISFDAVAKEDHVLLNWKTASESPGTTYEVQRSTDPLLGFESLGTINGHGNSSRISEYTFKDNTADPDILYYYRIQNSDPESKSQHTGIRTAKISGFKNAEYTITPSLFSDAITVQSGSDNAISKRFILIDLKGNIVMNEEMPLDSYSQTIHANDLPKGMYIATVMVDNKVVFTQKVQKAY